MSGGAEVVLRRTWPQRLVVLMCLAVIAGAVAAAWFVSTFYSGALKFQRVPIGPDRFGQPVLASDTPPGEPVNFLLVGTDSARGLDPSDPVAIGRPVDEQGRSLADTIMLLRLDPVSGSAWVLSIPRDLWVSIPGAADNKIATSLWIGGPELLVETVGATFDVVINHYVQIDFLGFREVVDVLGGVPVWFPYPARDFGSGLDVPTPGCRVLDGAEALQYVRGRTYQEQVDGRWVITGGDDFRRIERQQDFLVLALDRAIDRGARNLSTMRPLLEAGASSVVLDQNLTLAELVDLGQAFSGFNPDNLHRYGLQVYTLYRPDGAYQGEALINDANEPMLDVFRGAVDSVRPPDVSLTLTGADADDLQDAEKVLTGEGFVISDRSQRSVPVPETVVMHGPDERAAALLTATYLDPVPYVVEVADMSGVVVALGQDYRGILFLFQTPYGDMEAIVAAKGRPAAMPTPGGSLEPAATAAPPLAVTALTDSGPAPRLSASAGRWAFQSATAPAGFASGRPPPGESCQ